MKNLKNIIVLNVINVLMFLMIVLMAFLLPIFVPVLLGIAWLIFVLASNYNMIVRSNDPLVALREADKHHLFTEEIQKLSETYRSVTSQYDLFKNYGEDSNIFRSYDLIQQKICSNIASATSYLESYEYVDNSAFRRQSQYIRKLVAENEQMEEKLHDLLDLMVKIDDTTSEVDTTYVDELLDALREVVSDEQFKAK